MAAAETHLVTPGGALGDDAAPPDVRLVPGDAEEEEYEEPDPPLRPSACTGIGRLAASPLLGVARIAAAPFRILGRRRESLENEAAQLWVRRKELAAARDAEVARATAALLEEKASSELGAAERLKAVERGYEKALEAASREHEAQLAAERTQLQADAARAVDRAAPLSDASFCPSRVSFARRARAVCARRRVARACAGARRRGAQHVLVLVLVADAEDEVDGAALVRLRQHGVGHRTLVHPGDAHLDHPLRR